ncbi:flavodoxin domain-containing protein [Acetivibrio mesophilus]|uniref:Flavodoxin domain-containing protein n=1 Tax=Acetivibrio mesophilus TaxID=2487273 RepID=A0A4Q0I2F8_9FIRM|nr:flavodoxin domain-containing protein [Acetivibrio mesophilus]ODM27940.1 flavodoxin domain-containing protein [Clostridium sp. Bc-iso-3]RXE58376.1 flavodoxin domain-containing protein [Acetivibrio mesophilus]HHV28200.1 flavodoxin domain-containing protein [Clostridium sp.]
MIIVYESKTGFTKKYADMLAKNTKLKAYRVKELPKDIKDEEIIFLGWIKAGKIQGLGKVRKYNIKAVCASGTAPHAEPNEETVVANNKIESIPFFYLRGGCLPLKELTGMDKILMSMFLKILKSRKEKDGKIEGTISNIVNGFDGVREENLEPVVQWISKNK